MKKIVVAAVALAAMTGSALAADIYLPPAAPAAPMPPAAPAFSWEGSYVAAYAGRLWPTSFIAGFTVGHNFVRNSLVFGLEADVSRQIGGANMWKVALNGRAGIAVGSTDRLLLYGELGVGTFINSGVIHFTAGGGAEFAITDSISLFVESKAYICCGAGIDSIEISGGAAFHF